jgi:potassium channel LctB
VRLLTHMGYTGLRYYVGGIEDWLKSGGRIELTAAASNSARKERISRRLSWLERLANFSLERLVGLWLGMVVACGLIFWLAGIGVGAGLQAGNERVQADLEGLGTAIYFSFVTALSIGYGDVIPLGALRIFAITEGAAGLLIFGCVISKLVSHRQEELTREIHRTTFEDRLDRVRTNLHLVFSDLGSLQQLQAEQKVLPELVMHRLESTMRVFCGELQTVYDLLYRSSIVADEDTLESLLANLLICLQGLIEVNTFLRATHSPALDATLGSIGHLANEICGECVPRQYAPELKRSLDQIQELARHIARQ